MNNRPERLILSLRPHLKLSIYFSPSFSMILVVRNYSYLLRDYNFSPFFSADYSYYFFISYVVPSSIDKFFTSIILYFFFRGLESAQRGFFSFLNYSTFEIQESNVIGYNFYLINILKLRSLKKLSLVLKISSNSLWNFCIFIEKFCCSYSIQ